jgi:xanthine dehydrogenase accessory factor
MIQACCATSTSPRTYDPSVSIYSRLAQLTAAGRRHAVATVVRTQGSTPQQIGARLVVTTDENERPAGTLGGGCVEADAILASREILQRGGRSLRSYSLTEDLAWNTGLVCGGTMWILAEPGEEAIAADGRNFVEASVLAANGGPPIVLVTLLERRGHDLAFVGRMIIDAHGAATGTLGGATRDAAAIAAARQQLPHSTPKLMPVEEGFELLIEPITGRPRLVIAGGGHVAQAISRQAQLLDFDVTILEDRPEFSDPARFGGARVLSGHIPDTLGTLEYGWNSYIVIATRGHKLDADCLLSAVRTDARYIGLLGSRRKAALVSGMLKEEGVPQSRIDAIRTPVGLDLGGRTPAEIALSVLAEITQTRYRTEKR